MSRYDLREGDCFDLFADVPSESVDAVVSDPPYGLEFMGKAWDSFRPEGAVRSARWAGERSGDGGAHLSIPSGLGYKTPLPSFGDKRPTTARCLTCGRRDAFQKPHSPCGDGAWVVEPVNPGAAPPAMLAFQEFCAQWAREAYRVLRPGGHLLAFSSTRTYHRMACAIEDAGFEVRDQVDWVYGQGFPKSLDVSKAIDRAAGAARRVVGWKESGLDRGSGASVSYAGSSGRDETGLVPITAPATDDARRWEGWGTALKPAHEPFCVARKPFAGSVAANVLAHGAGALNLGACRVGTSGGTRGTGYPKTGLFGMGGNATIIPIAAGRWPPNVLLAHAPDCAPGACAEGCPVASVERQTPGSSRFFPVLDWSDEDLDPVLYCPKPSRAARGARELLWWKRPIGRPPPEADDLLKGWKERGAAGGTGRAPSFEYVRVSEAEWLALPDDQRIRGNIHPTVKPVALMRWLCRLVTPPGGLVLDPFTGSGSTGVAALREGLRFLGFERDPTYALVARARLAREAPDPRPDPTGERVIAALR